MNAFEALGLSASLIRWIEAEGFTEPTEVQAKAIPILIAGGDLLGTAQTGEGKTAAYLLPVLHRLIGDGGEAVEAPLSRRPQVLVLAPTRELASQIGDQLRIFSKGMRVYYTVVFGGSRFLTQQKVLERGVQILIATPGRLMDHHRRGTVKLDRVTTFVLDEADRMLDMGFVNEVKEIADLLQPAHQTIMFSATMSRGVRDLAKGLLHNPERLDVGKENAVAVNVDHRVMRVQYRDKKPLLMHLLGREDVRRALIFTRTKSMADQLAGEIKEAGLAADAIHGDREQSTRQKVLKDFRDGTINILVATDVAARGIDVPDITHVINYDMPVEGDAYVHRVGRTGRAGNRGVALSIATGSEGNLVRIVERVIGQRIPVDADHPFHDGRPDHSVGHNEPRQRKADPRQKNNFEKKNVEKKDFEKKRGFEKKKGFEKRHDERKPFAKRADAKPHRKGPRSEYAERPVREDRFERPQGSERPQHIDRAEHSQRSDRPAREHRAERPPREDRPERPQREWRPENKPYREENRSPDRKRAGQFDRKFDKRSDRNKDSDRVFEAFGSHKFKTPKKPDRRDEHRERDERTERRPDAPAIRAKDGVTAFRTQDGGRPPFKKKKPFKKKDGSDHAGRADVPQKSRADLAKGRADGKGKGRERPFERETRGPEVNAGGFKPRTRRR